MRRTLLIAGFALALFGGAPAFAAEKLDDSELADVRAGFESASGMMFYFSVTMTTTINGQVVLETTLNVTPQGTTLTQTAASGAQNLSQAGKYGLNIGSSVNGVLIPGLGGATAIIQNTSGQIVNILLNNASNLQITQNTALSLSVPNLEGLKQAASQVSVGGAMAGAINGALTLLSGH